MADRPLVLNHVLCFLFSKLDKCHSVALERVVRNFYNAQDILTAKNVLMEVVSNLSIENLPNIPRRRDGEQRTAHEMEDIMSIITAVDESKAIDSLPIFVSDSPDKMPSVHLVEGDLRAIMEKFDRFEHSMRGIQSIVGALQSDMAAINRTHTVPVPVAGGSKGPSVSTVSVAVGRDSNNNSSMNERSVNGRGTVTSMQQRSGAYQLNEELLHSGNWSDCSGSISGSMSCDDDRSCYVDGEWRTQSSKRRRVRSQQLNNAVTTERSSTDHDTAAAAVAVPAAAAT